MNKQIFSIWVENQLGVLSKVAALFGETGLNIESLAVGNTEVSNVSRITIATNGEDDCISAVISKMNEIANLIKVKNITEDSSLLRELAIIMVEAPEAKRQSIISISEIFRAQIVDVGIRTMTLELSGSQDKIQAMEDLLKPFGIREIVRTGIIAIDRANRIE